MYFSVLCGNRCTPTSYSNSTSCTCNRGRHHYHTNGRSPVTLWLSNGDCLNYIVCISSEPGRKRSMEPKAGGSGLDSKRRRTVHTNMTGEVSGYENNILPSFS